MVFCPNNFALGLTIFAAAIGLLGNLLASYLHWIIINYLGKNESKKCYVHIFGIIFVLLFFFLIILAYLIYSKGL